MRKIRLLVGLIILLFIFFPFVIARAQDINFKISKPNCNPFAIRYDNPLPNLGWNMPRIGWHILYPTIGIGISKGISYVSKNKIPPLIASSIATLSIGLLPHIRGGILRRDYPIDLMDWSYDLWNRSLPSWNYLSDRENNKRDYLIYFGGDLALSCFAHP